MRRDLPLWTLVAGAVATYPAIALAWCVGMLIAMQPGARALSAAGHPAALAAVVLTIVGTVSVGMANVALFGGLRRTRRFGEWAAERRVQPPAVLVAHARELRIPVTLVDTGEFVAATVGLVRPYVVVSTGLVNALTGKELRAVLSHERAHLRRRDPLRMLAGSVLAAHLWFLPVSAELRASARRGYELGADRHAARGSGSAALAGALLRVTSGPGGYTSAERAFVSRFADEGSLEARVRQLESGSAPRTRPAPVRSVVSVAIALAFMATVAGAWMFMLIACPCATVA